MIKIVSVCFNALSTEGLQSRGHTHYDYVLPDGMEAQLGDIAVVNSPCSGVVPTLIVGVAETSKKATRKVEVIISMAPSRSPSDAWTACPSRDCRDRPRIFVQVRHWCVCRLYVWIS